MHLNVSKCVDSALWIRNAKRNVQKHDKIHGDSKKLNCILNN